MEDNKIYVKDIKNVGNVYYFQEIEHVSPLKNRYNQEYKKRKNISYG